MFRHCGGFGRRESHAKGSDDGNSSSDDDEEEDYGMHRRREQDLTSSNHDTTTSTTSRFLLEIVGAMGLSTLGDDVDSFCVVSKVQASDNKKSVIHRTKTIPNDTAPIWTLKTKSICFVELDKKSQPGEKIQIELCRKSVGIPGIMATDVIGTVELTYPILLANGDSNRREYPVMSEQHLGIVLALRFRKATPQDWTTFQELHLGGNGSSTRPRADHAGDVDFEFVSSKGIIGNHTTVVENNTSQKAYRVWPFPDPDNPKDTTYMTKSKIQQISMEPSRSWVEAAGGATDNYGSIFLEILGCDDLPNMDMELVDGLTDAFVACVFEDNFVRTAVIHDSLNPRWMPWSHRAFEFHIQHPSSILMLGVFDYDDNPLESHDPIGRVVIVPTLFEKETMYTLKYPLYHENESRGTLTVRLRIHWHNAADASKAQSFVRPPRFIINVRTAKAWKTLRYLTRGSTDMTDVTLESVKLYATEVLEHWQRYCYFLDVLAHILLWRGRVTVWGCSIWFPIDSIVFFVGLSLAVEFPAYMPSVAFYLIAYALLCNNYYLSNHPSPWSRVRSFTRVAVNNHFSSTQKVVIEPEKGAEEAQILRRLNQYKGIRVMAFLYTSIIGALKVYRVYSKNTPVDISTVSKSGSVFSKLYVNYLYYAHVCLRMVCKYSRLFRNFVNWRAGSTYKLTIDLLLFATTWALFPYKHVIINISLRAVVWIILGPQNKFIDIIWVQPYYRTKEQLLADGIPETVEEMKEEIASRPNILENMLTSKWVHEMGKSGRIVVEDNLKLQAAREAHYGKYSEAVPAVDFSRFASVPTSSSFAQTFVSLNGDGDTTAIKSTDGCYQDIGSHKKIWSKVPGQKLYGNIIPIPKTEVG